MAAQRNFDRLIEVFEKTETRPRPDFTHEIMTQLHTTQIETLFYKSKKEQRDLKNEQILDPKWRAKLCLRDSLQRIYDVSVKNQERELSLQSLKIQ